MTQRDESKDDLKYREAQRQLWMNTYIATIRKDSYSSHDIAMRKAENAVKSFRLCFKYNK